MARTWVWCCALALLLAVAGCSDDDAAENNGVANNGNNGVNNGANNGVNNGANNGENNGENNGANNGVERPPCETIESIEQAEATYDAYLLPPLEEVVPSLSYVAATVVRDGNDVTVLVDDDEGIPATFDTTVGFEHCVINPDASFIKLCFFTAAGEPAAPGALGAVFRPFGNALFAVVAHRREVVRPCTAAGHYSLDQRSLSGVVGDAAFNDEVADALVGYLGVFQIAGVTTVVFGEEPRQVVVEYDDATGAFSGSFEDELRLDDEGAVYDLTITFDGTLTLAEDGAASASVTSTVEVSGGDLDSDASFTAELSGDRL